MCRSLPVLVTSVVIGMDGSFSMSYMYVVKVMYGIHTNIRRVFPRTLS